MRTMVWMIGLVLAGGCFTDPGGTGGPVTTDPGPSTGAGTSTGAPTSTEPGTSTSTGTSEVGSSEAGSSGSSSGEPTSTSTTGGNEGKACDPWAQDCGAELKCVPYASDGGASWDANKCTPVGVGELGASCKATDSATSGYDSCAAGAICWEVDPQTLVGVCYALCSGQPDAPVCPPNSLCSMTNGGAVNVCLGDCNPLNPDCDDGQVCVPDNAEQFLCLASADPLPVGTPCEYVNECVLGSMCGPAALATKLCIEDAPLCCLEYCDLEDPQACPDALTCVAYFAEGEAPQELVNLGLCQD